MIMHEQDRDGDISVIIPAAGESSRMGGEVRKPFLTLAGSPILFRTCQKLSQVDGVFEIVVALHPDDVQQFQETMWEEASASGITLAVAGGGCRAETVWNALQVVSARAELVAVHDAVRPFFTEDMVKALISTARKRGAAVPVVPMQDTPKRVEGDTIVSTPRRTGMMRAQTPQIFKSDLLIEAFEYAMRTGGISDFITDDSQLVETMGVEVAAVLGDERNVKITSPGDLRLAEMMLAAGMVQ